MAPSETFDVLVLGGGPAGIACALTLCRYGGRRVAVVERTGYETQRIGETLSPGLQATLEYLGVWDRFIADNHQRAYGTAAAWGNDELQTRDFIMTPFGAGWHLDRRRFDISLMEIAEAAGVSLLHRAKATVFRRAGGGWRLTVEQDATARVLEAPILVDATGRRAVVARLAGAQRQVLDSLVALTAIVKLGPSPAADMLTLVEACPDGWWYSARLPEGRMAVALMTDPDLIRQNGWAETAGWCSLLRQQRHTWPRLAQAATAQPRLVPAFSACMTQSAGEDWIAAGDAACGHDPLSSSGIARALDTGIQAARAVDARLRSGRSDAMVTYAKWIASGFATYWTTRMAYYAIEQRWPDAPFWKRRQPRVTLNPQQPIDRAPAARAAGGGRRMVDHALLGRLCAPPATAHEIVARYRQEATMPAPEIEIILALQSLLQETATAAPG